MLAENRVRVESKRNGKRPAAAAISARLMSRTPGRLRFRVAPPHRHPATMARFGEALRSRFPADRIRVNPNNGGVTIYYDRDRTDGDRIDRILREDLNVRFRGADTSEAAAALTEAVAVANRQVDRATEGAMDLRFLVPLGFGTLAVRQLMAEGLQLDVIPWYALAWYAFDSFIKLHYSLRRDGAGQSATADP